MSKILKSKTTLNIIKWVSVLLLGLYSISLLYLYYNQTLYFSTGIFESDLPYHLKFAVEDKFFYSFTTFLYLALSYLPGFNYLVAFFLMLATIGSIFLTDGLLKKLFVENNIRIYKEYTFIIAFVLNFVIGFYLSFAGKSHYVAYQSGNLWHNSTYIFMRVFALWCLSVFVDYHKSYKVKIDLKKWFLLSIILMVTTGIKASFFTVFGPVMAIILLYDLITGTKFVRVFVAALTVVPSLAVVLFQNIVLFGNDTGNGFVINPFYTLSLRGEHPKVTVILSILFPLMVGVLHIKDVWKNKYYLTSILIFFFGFIEVFFFAESGARSKDGNFLWGYSISIFVIFFMSMVLFIKDILETFKKGYAKELGKKEINSKLILIKKCWLVITLLVLVWHLISGIWYYCLLLTGVTYFI